jgi:hypothetical protein
MAKKWETETPKGAKLPKRAKKTTRRRKKKAAKKLQVMRFNVKDGERYPTEIDAGDFRHHINGDVGLADLLVNR